MYHLLDPGTSTRTNILGEPNSNNHGWYNIITNWLKWQWSFYIQAYTTTTQSLLKSRLNIDYTKQ